MFKPTYIQLLAIKLFRLSNITDLLVKARTSQYNNDKKHYDEVIKDEKNSLHRAYALQLQEKDSEIAMLQQQIDMYKQEKKEVENREHLARKQIKENSFVMRSASDYMKEFTEAVSSIYGKMDKIRDTVEKQKRVIEDK